MHPDKELEAKKNEEEAYSITLQHLPCSRKLQCTLKGVRKIGLVET